MKTSLRVNHELEKMTANSCLLFNNCRRKYWSHVILQVSLILPVRFPELVLIPCKVATVSVAVESVIEALSHASTDFIVFHSAVPVILAIISVSELVVILSGLTKVFNV